MSESEQRHAYRRAPCGADIAGMSVAALKCPDCGQEISRCSRCRKRSNLYECLDCGFMGP